MKFTQAVIIVPTYVRSNGFIDKKRNKEVPSQNSNVNKHMTDFESSKRQNKKRFTLSMTIAPTHVRSTGTLPKDQNKGAPSQSSNVSKQKTEFERTKRENETRLIQATIYTQTRMCTMFVSKHMTVVFNVLCLAQVRQ